MLLLKEYSNTGFTFYTNSISRKGQDIYENPNVAMLFYWPFVNRQVKKNFNLNFLLNKT